MASIANRRFSTILYARAGCPWSHCTRIVLSEKEIPAQVVDVTAEGWPEDLVDLNPYNTLPTLVDRDLVLYDIQVILEYLDERYPFPPLMPADPVSRAMIRLMILRLGREWYGRVDDLASKDERRAAEALKALSDNLATIAPLFGKRPFLLSDEFSLADCCFAPLLWRLLSFRARLPAPDRAMMSYAERLFNRPSFQTSLTLAERQMRR
jgi:RNA polymerase-associated protein